MMKEKSSSGNIVNILELILDFKQCEDGTYEIRSGERIEYKQGFQVSYVRPEAFNQLTPQQWDEITNCLAQYLQGDVCLGVYNGSVEVSIHTLDSNKAFQVMQLFNQESIYDWNNNCREIIDRFILNQNFDPKKEINYNEIIKSIL